MFGIITNRCSLKHYLNEFERAVKFKDLSSLEIQNYIETREPMIKQEHAIQGKGALFVEKIEGDYYNIVDCHCLS